MVGGIARRLPLAQAGIPFTTGFLAKLEVISASVGAHSTALAVVAMVSAAIAAFFYLRVILVMYLPRGIAMAGTGEGDDLADTAADGSALTAPVTSAASGTGAAPETATSARGALATAEDAVASAPDEAVPEPVAGTVVAAIAICVGVTLLFGVWPAPLVNFAHQARLLFG